MDRCWVHIFTRPHPSQTSAGLGKFRTQEFGGLEMALVANERGLRGCHPSPQKETGPTFPKGTSRTCSSMYLPCSGRTSLVLTDGTLMQTEFGCTTLAEIFVSSRRHETRCYCSYSSDCCCCDTRNGVKLTDLPFHTRWLILANFQKKFLAALRAAKG